MKPENILISVRKKVTREFDDNGEMQKMGSAFPSNTANDQIDEIDINDNVNDDVDYIVKVGDFGLAREIKSKPPYTDYVSTRW